MDTRRARLGIGLLLAGLVGLAVLLVVVLVSADGAPEPELERPVEEPEPEPEPEPPPPVTGSAEVAAVVDLSVSDSRLAPPGSSADQPVDIDERAVDDLVGALTEWLDAHLTDLQEGGDGLVAEVGLAGPTEVGDLAGSGAVVEEATYRMAIGARGEPEWARVVVEVTDADGGAHEATFAFTGAVDVELQGVEGSG